MLKRLALQQPPAFDDVYREHSDYAYNLALRLSGSPCDADDVFQETFLRIHRFLASYRGGSLRGWVRRITVNTFHSLRRRLRPVEPLDQDPGTRQDDPAWRLEHNQLGDLERALATLPEDQRVVLLLRELDELSYEELADLLSVPVGTVRSRLARARSALRAALGEEKP